MEDELKFSSSDSGIDGGGDAWWTRTEDNAADEDGD
jgi:hypothetical protein